MSNFFNKKTVLITGGTGSFGKAAVRALLKMKNIKKIIVFSRDELKQYEISSQFSKKENKILRFFIGDVRDYKRLEMAARNVDYIIHAAALKQVPTAEYNPFEFIKTNVVGAQNIIEASFKNNVKKVVALSTDKASSPINLYGATKLCSDKLFIAANNMVGDKKISFSVIRYGNVAGSRGSVIPLFISQIINNQSITITDPMMTRFLMSLDEAVSLVKYAFNNASQGELFIKKAPACSINTLAQALLDIFNADNKIEIIGSRHGEKLYESLLSREEMSRALDHENYFSIPLDNKDLNYSKFFDEGDKKISEIEDYNSHNTQQLSVKEVKEKLLLLPYVKKYLN